MLIKSRNKSHVSPAVLYASSRTEITADKLSCGGSLTSSQNLSRPIVFGLCVPLMPPVPEPRGVEGVRWEGSGARRVGEGTGLDQKACGDTVALITLHPPFFLFSSRCPSHSLHTSVSAPTRGGEREGGRESAKSQQEITPPKSHSGTQTIPLHPNTLTGHLMKCLKQSAAAAICATQMYSTERIKLHSFKSQYLSRIKYLD